MDIFHENETDWHPIQLNSLLINAIVDSFNDIQSPLYVFHMVYFLFPIADGIRDENRLLMWLDDVDTNCISEFGQLLQNTLQIFGLSM